jgi:hypothetical protein
MRSEGNVPKNREPKVGLSFTPLGFGQGSFKARNSVMTLEHLSYSPGLAAADVYLFPRLKSAWKRRSFCGVIDVIKNGTEELKRL